MENKKIILRYKIKKNYLEMENNKKNNPEIQNKKKLS